MPALSAVNDDPMSTTLSASLMMSAEVSQPWSTIGFDQWIGTGRWWLLRAQVVLRTITESEQSVAPAAYAALIKATWILIDVIPCHPQFPFISASKSSELQSLSAEVRNEFSRVTALAMVVPALGELSSQHLRLWESVPLKAPTLRPYKVSQNLDALRGDGGEQVLFRRFAFYEPDSFRSSPCILLFLVHESAKAARLIAQDQYDGIVRVITSPDLDVNRGEDGKSVMVGKEKFVLNHVREAQVLCNMIEATTFYIFGRQADHASLEDLKAYILLTAVKNREEQAAAHIRREICKPDNIVESDRKGSLAQLAVSITSQWIKGRRHFQDDRSLWRHWQCWSPKYSLLNWAVVCNHTTLTEYLLSEDPIIDNESEQYHRSSLELSAEFGNAPVVRWCLDNTSCRDTKVTLSLFTAIASGHAKIIALLVDAGVVLHHDFCDITHQALRSALSEVVIHAILAMAYATMSGSDIHLRQAADRGHEGAIVLLSYAETMQRLAGSFYLRHSTRDFGYFKQIVAVLAKVPGIVPAFDLTLMTVERRKTVVLLKVVGLPLGLDVRVYLDSYHAYVENVPEGLSETYKKAFKIEMSGEFSFTVVHQEESLRFSVSKQPEPSHPDHFEYSAPVCSDVENFIFDTFEDCRVEIPIDCAKYGQGTEQLKPPNGDQTEKTRVTAMTPHYFSISTQLISPTNRAATVSKAL